MGDKNVLLISKASEMFEASNRRTFFKLMAAGGAVVLLPSMLAGCDSPSGTGLNGTSGNGNTATIDFSAGDTAILQFAYVLEQLEADFYTRVVAAFSGSNLTTADQAVLSDISYHEVIHRDFLQTVLGSNATNLTITTVYPGVNFSDRTSVLTTAQTYEFLGVAAYNGAGQYISSATYLTLAGKIVSVEARHASAISDLITPNSGSFAPRTFENADKPATVAAAAQTYITQTLTFKNAPTTFAQGPNNNG
jgi:hypothetical protein